MPKRLSRTRRVLNEPVNLAARTEPFRVQLSTPTFIKTRKAPPLPPALKRCKTLQYNFRNNMLTCNRPNLLERERSHGSNIVKIWFRRKHPPSHARRIRRYLDLIMSWVRTLTQL